MSGTFSPLSYLPFLALLYFFFIAWSDFKSFRRRDSNDISVHRWFGAKYRHGFHRSFDTYNIARALVRSNHGQKS